MTFMLRDAFADTVPLRQAMERLFDESLPRPSRHWLSVNVYETPTDLVIEAALPGVKPDDVDIAIDGDTLSITGEWKADEGPTEREYHRRELHAGPFERALRLPDRFQSDLTTALFRNGILTLTIPKVKQASVQHIKVQPGTAEAVEGAITRQADG